MPTLLVVDDEPGICRALEQALAPSHRVVSVPSAEAALERLEALEPDLVLLDVGLPRMDGLEFLDRLRERPHPPPVIVITAQGTMGTAVQAVKRGACEFLVKPVDLDMVQILVDRALERVRLSSEVVRLRAQGGAGGDDLVGVSAAMQEVYKRIGAVAGAEVPVLLTGESGSGKELAAKAIHAHSGRAGGPFVAVNCAALPEPLLQSELFGHERGAFTGAVARRRGRFETAHGGTLLLDEVGEMPASTQVALLRILESRAFERVGGSEPVAVDVRVLAATNQDLPARIASGRFREDLYYRLNGVGIRLPPLRERLDDLPLLVAHFLQRERSARVLSAEAMQALRRHPWPGNVRELRNAIAHAAALALGGTILPEHLPPEIAQGTGGRAAQAGGTLEPWLDLQLLQAPPEGVYGAVLEALERPLLAKVMAMTGGNQVQAARRLGLHRTTLRHKLEKHGLAGREAQEDRPA